MIFEKCAKPVCAGLAEPHVLQGRPDGRKGRIDHIDQLRKVGTTIFDVMLTVCDLR